MRTDDTDYGAEYWNTLDNGLGYADSCLWEDLALITKEVLVYDTDGRDNTNNNNLLDMGCAYGYLVKHLRRRGLESYGADFSQYALDHAPEDLKHCLRQFDITKDNVGTLPGWPFSFLTCFETLEHIPEEHVDTALFQLYRAIKAGGKGLLTICTDDRPGWDSDPTHVTIKSRDWWAEKLIATGFTLEDISFVKKFHLFRDHGGTFIVRRP